MLCRNAQLAHSVRVMIYCEVPIVPPFVFTPVPATDGPSFGSGVVSSWLAASASSSFLRFLPAMRASRRFSKQHRSSRDRESIPLPQMETPNVPSPFFQTVIRASTAVVKANAMKVASSNVFFISVLPTERGEFREDNYTCQGNCFSGERSSGQFNRFKSLKLLEHFQVRCVRVLLLV